MPRILGIDPGYGRLGYAVIDVVRGKPKAITYGVVIEWRVIWS
jgi:Holliday junction resolvasome RuvABC endonuclease subunit